MRSALASVPVLVLGATVTLNPAHADDAAQQQLPRFVNTTYFEWDQALPFLTGETPDFINFYYADPTSHPSYQDTVAVYKSRTVQLYTDYSNVYYTSPFLWEGSTLVEVEILNGMGLEVEVTYADGCIMGYDAVPIGQNFYKANRRQDGMPYHRGCNAWLIHWDH